MGVVGWLRKRTSRLRFWAAAARKNCSRTNFNLRRRLLYNSPLRPMPVKAEEISSSFPRFTYQRVFSNDQITVVSRWDEFCMAHSATTINENVVCWQYAVPRRVVQRSSTLLVLESPRMSLTRDALWHNGL